MFTNLRNALIMWLQTERQRQQQAEGEKRLAQKAAKAAADKARAEAEREAFWVDEGHRLNFYQVDDFLAGRRDSTATPPPSATEWAALKASWTPKQYTLTVPSIQGGVAADRFGSMVNNTAAEIAAEKWKLLAGIANR